jgi:hypothetical protein
MSATLTPSSTHAALRMQRRVRVGQILLTVLLVLCALVAISTAFSDDPFPSAAVVLIASFGVLAAAFGLVTVWSVGTSRAARAAVWALPVFFIVHVAALGTWIPDALFAVAAAIGALLAQPGRDR